MNIQNEDRTTHDPMDIYGARFEYFEDCKTGRELLFGANAKTNIRRVGRVCAGLAMIGAVAAAVLIHKLNLGVHRA